MEIAFSTVLADSREVALELCAAFRDPRTITRTFELAWSDARVELKHLGISAAQSQRFQRLASALVFPLPGLRPPTEVLARNTRGRESLWRYGISGDLPILLLRLDDGEPAELMRELLLAHEFWRLNRFTADLVILNEEPGGYLQPVQDQVAGVLRQATTQAKLDQPGGVYLRRSDQMPEEDRILLQSSARAVLLASQGSLARQLRRAAPADGPAPERLAVKVHAAATTAVVAPGSAAKAPPGLQLWNGRGGFSADGREYVIRVSPGAPTPAPWLNVIANDRFGFTVSERGSGFTWVENSQTHRLTPWSNDAVTDPAFECVYLRDDENGAVWSATPAPAGAQLEFVVRHGQGYSVFEHEHDGLRLELTVFTAARAAAKVSRLRVRNAGGRARRLSVIGCVEWVLGTTQARSAASVITQRDETTGALLARNPFSVFPHRVAFFAGTVPAESHTCDRLELFGRQGSRALPAGLRLARLSGRSGAGLDPCAALHVQLALAAGEEREVAFVLGEGQDAEEARALVREHAEASRVQEHLDAAVRAWDDLLGVVTVKTPDPGLDLLQNRWLLYQAVGCRIWARSAFYQSGGAYGFRDQLQDSLATVHAAPALCREHILRSAARQFVEGDVQHWWHPESGQGVRTRYADDLLWLPYVVALYIGATGDQSVLDEAVPFIESRQLEPEEHEVFGVPNVSTTKESVYEHCVRALDKGATAGPHGLPLMGGGDWNDGMNRVGEGGRGESVWMAWFLAATCKAFAPLARARGDAQRVAWCEAQIERLRRAVEEHAWDGAWYRRAYFDDGTPMGTKDAAECRIDAIAQSWAVISGIGDPERARRAMRSTEEHLVRDAEEMVLLFTPPFEHSVPNPGYVQSYPAGLRENGGQYTHGVLWSALATAMLGDGDRAHAMLRMLGPVSHGDTPEEVERYAVEPYVVAADVYAAEGLMGRGGWTWYTGSASWLYRITLEALLGIVRRGDKLRIAPVIPRAWPGFEVRYRHGASTWRIVVENTAGAAREHGAGHRRGRQAHRWRRAAARRRQGAPGPRGARRRAGPCRAGLAGGARLRSVRGRWTRRPTRG
ncbi:MAG: hypothetical protein WKG00_18850 [Polyangiaceae bacterium]